MAKRAADLAISPLVRQEDYLVTAERSARARIEQAERDATNRDDAVQAQAEQARRDQAQSAHNARQITELNAQLLHLERQHRHVRFLPAWLKAGYTAKKTRLQSQMAELERYSTLFQLRASRSQHMLQMATAQETKRQVQALARLADESARQRSILMATSTARRLRSFPGFAWLPAAALMELAARLNRFRANRFDNMQEDPDFRVQAPR